jgi:hypothetical protein
MAILSKPEIKASHWYTNEGKAMHSVTKADGEGERPTTIRDARKHTLIPSVTNILGVIGKDALTTWKVNQAILQTLISPKTENESNDYYCKRIQSESMTQVQEAADLGSKIHHAMENWLIEKVQPPQDAMTYVQPVMDWFSATGLNVTDTEKILVNAAEGYAGTADVIFTYGKKGCGILDFKTRRTKEGKKVEAYVGQAMQLAAYAAAEFGENVLDKCLLANIYISTTEPGRIEVIKHDNPRKHYDAFLNCCALWRYEKDYDPRQ